ncbi:MAG: antitoxin MazE5 [Actinomycetota bacterium]
MTRSVTVRLSEEHIEWLRAEGRSITDGVRDAVDQAIRNDSYRRAEAVLREHPLDAEDDWGDVESFMIDARADAR